MKNMMSTSPSGIIVSAFKAILIMFLFYNLMEPHMLLKMFSISSSYSCLILDPELSKLTIFPAFFSLTFSAIAS